MLVNGWKKKKVDWKKRKVELHNILKSSNQKVTMTVLCL